MAQRTQESADRFDSLITSLVCLRIPDSVLLLFLLALNVRNALLHPFRRGRAFQKVVEEFLQAPRVVLLIDAPAQAVLLAVVAEHINLFAQASKRAVILDALTPRHGVIYVVVNHPQR